MAQVFLSNSSNIVSCVYNARKILLEQLKANDYDTEDFELFSANEINAMYKNKQMDMIIEKNKEDPVTNTKKKIYVKYYLGKSISTKVLQDIIDELFNLVEILTKNDTLLVIVKEEINDTTLEYLKHIWETDGIFVIIQNLKRLQFNVLKHSMVPSHRIISKNEIDIVKNRYNISNDNQFPKISRFDPVSIAIGIKPGEVCEILRPSKTSIITKYYRLCYNI
jgi:DNA-directed RNA polymerase subunit H (RpoH/RPB5)